MKKLAENIKYECNRVESGISVLYFEIHVITTSTLLSMFIKKLDFVCLS